MLFMQLFLKLLSGMANSVDPDQTAPSSVHHYVLLYSMILHAVNELSPFIIRFYCIQRFCKQSMSFLRLSLFSIVFNDSASSQ